MDPAISIAIGSVAVAAVRALACALAVEPPDSLAATSSRVVSDAKDFGLAISIALTRSLAATAACTSSSTSRAAFADRSLALGMGSIAIDSALGESIAIPPPLPRVRSLALPLAAAPPTDGMVCGRGAGRNRPARVLRERCQRSNQKKGCGLRET